MYDRSFRAVDAQQVRQSYQIANCLNTNRTLYLVYLVSDEHELRNFNICLTFLCFKPTFCPCFLSVIDYELFMICLLYLLDWYSNNIYLIVDLYIDKLQLESYKSLKRNYLNFSIQIYLLSNHITVYLKFLYVFEICLYKNISRTNSSHVLRSTSRWWPALFIQSVSPSFRLLEEHEGGIPLLSRRELLTRGWRGWEEKSRSCV